MNFVKIRLALEKIAVGEILEVWISPGSDASFNIAQSIAQEGHEILKEEIDDAHGTQKLWICRKEKEPRSTANS